MSAQGFENDLIPLPGEHPRVDAGEGDFLAQRPPEQDSSSDDGYRTYAVGAGVRRLPIRRCSRPRRWRALIR